MPTYKKKDLKYKDPLTKKIEDSDEELLDELIDATGGVESGSEPGNMASSITTAPQAQTTDDFNTVAIQPNRSMFGISAQSYVRGNVGETFNKLNSRFAMEKLLEKYSGTIVTGDNQITDVNNNDLQDTVEMPSNINNKLDGLIYSCKETKISSEVASMVLSEVIANILPMVTEPKDKENLIKMIKNG